MHKEQIGERIAEFEARCRDKGLALTVQRRLIFATLLEYGEHPTVDQVYEAVKNRIPGISRTTVYRVLNTLVTLGMLRRHAHGGAVARFDANVERHDHLVCVRCEKVIDVPPSYPSGPPLPDTRRLGFEIHNYSIEFTGLCARCRELAEAAGEVIM